jgi:GNAT superfamily N-acetyltransferase
VGLGRSDPEGTLHLSLPLEIRDAREDDVPVLERAFPRRPADVHRTRFARQAAGGGTYVVAISDDRPVGFVFVNWTGCGDEFLRGRLDSSRVPHLEDLLVAEDVRRRGVAGRILEAAEQLAATRGFDRIGVNVSVENDPAAALYEARGFEDAGIEPYEIADAGLREDGTRWSWSETVVYLVKRL